MIYRIRKDVIELEFKLHLHNKGYKAKPSGKEIGLISKEITSEVTTITPAELALKVGQEGHCNNEWQKKQVQHDSTTSAYD